MGAEFKRVSPWSRSLVLGASIDVDDAGRRRGVAGTATHGRYYLTTVLEARAKSTEYAYRGVVNR